MFLAVFFGFVFFAFIRCHWGRDIVLEAEIGLGRIAIWEVYFLSGFG